jgi:hypothetical protein
MIVSFPANVEENDKENMSLTRLTSVEKKRRKKGQSNAVFRMLMHRALIHRQ